MRLQPAKDRAESSTPMFCQTPSFTLKLLTVVSSHPYTAIKYPALTHKETPVGSVHTHTQSFLNVLWHLFFHIRPVPHSFSLLRATNGQIIRKPQGGGGQSSSIRSMQVNSIIELMHHSRIQRYFKKWHNNFVERETQKRAPTFHIRFIPRQSSSSSVL